MTLKIEADHYVLISKGLECRGPEIKETKIRSLPC